MAHSQTEQQTKHAPFSATPFSLWLSWHELNRRKIVFSINVILIALFIALPVSLDLMGRAKKSTVETRIDYIGPSLILVPKGIISSDLVTARLKGQTVSSSLFSTVNKQFKSYLRNAEPRLTLRLPIEGKNTPVTGIDFTNVYSYPFAEYSISGNEALIGKVTSEKFQITRGDTISVQSKTFRISGVIPTTGSIEDASVFVALGELQNISDQTGRINEIRLFPESLSSYEQLKSLLKKYDRKLNIIDAYRGDTAEKNVDTTLVSYQKVLYTAAFILIGLCIMISTYINLDARKTEIATVFTIGTNQSLIFQILTLRTFWITILGSFTGQVIAFIITVIKTHKVPLKYIWSTGSFIEVMLGTVCLGMLITVPFAFYSVYKRDLISHL